MIAEDVVNITRESYEIRTGLDVCGGAGGAYENE